MDKLSKAAEYAALPKPAVPSLALNKVSAFVTDNGELMLRDDLVRVVVTAADALVLRDWLTATFDVVCAP